MAKRFWSHEDFDEISTMKAEGKSREQIARHFGVTVSALDTACSRMKSPKVRKTEPKGDFRKTTHREIAARAARKIRDTQALHLDLTAAFFGDPLPGQSALDRRLAGIVDEPVRDHRNSHILSARPVTLPSAPFRLEREGA